MLLSDPDHGTAIVTDDRDVPNPNFDGDVLHVKGGWSIVAWRPGYTGRWVGSEVEVLDPMGSVVAVTGSHYTLDGVFVDQGASGWPDADGGTFWACAAHPD